MIWVLVGKRAILLKPIGSGLVAGCVGQTAIKTKTKIDEARDGNSVPLDEVLFTDGHLCDGQHAFGQEAVDTLLKEMEDKPDRLVVIVAGYPDLMRQFVTSNPGLPSRFAKQSTSIVMVSKTLLRSPNIMARRDGLNISRKTEEALKAFFALAMQRPNFGNARTARTLLERAARSAGHAACARYWAKGTSDLAEITHADISTATAEFS